MADLVFQNLDKFQFLTRNKAQIEAYLHHIDGRLVSDHGRDRTAVTIEDVWVITNCEAGITQGKVNPRFRHSEGEVGFYPLPSNIAFWNGADAPPFDRFTSLEENVFHYLLYIGHLKNRVVKTIDGLELHRDLFRGHAGAPSAARHAKIVAGIVHGYFFKGTYSDQIVPLQHLLDGYTRDRGLADMMRTTTYKHAGTTIMSNREANIATALRRVQQRPVMRVATGIPMPPAHEVSASRRRKVKARARKSQRTSAG
jgi:hypothetical protein